MAKGRFITVEGGEGVGKTAFTLAFEQRLRALGIPYHKTFEPGGTPTANKMRELFLAPPEDDSLVMRAEFCLVSAARAQHVAKVVQPALQQGTWVLCDRFADSARVYQGALGGLASADVEAIITFSTSGLEPDITFLLDCDTDVSLQRLESRQQASTQAVTRFDSAKQAMHENIRQHFLNLHQRFPRRILVLDASQPIAAVADLAMAEVRRRFRL